MDEVDELLLEQDLLSPQSTTQVLANASANKNNISNIYSSQIFPSLSSNIYAESLPTSAAERRAGAPRPPGGGAAVAEHRPINARR